jgi:hypothetical protein
MKNRSVRELYGLVDQRGKSSRRHKYPLFLELLEKRMVLSSLQQLVSPANAVLPASDVAGDVSQAMVSADGQSVVYSSTAPNLLAGQTSPNADSNIFLYDTVTKATKLVSHSFTSNTTGGDGDSDQPRISSDGRFVVYESSATDLISDQVSSHGQENVFLFDNSTNSTFLVSHPAAGWQRYTT